MVSMELVFVETPNPSKFTQNVRGPVPGPGITFWIVGSGTVLNPVVDQRAYDAFELDEPFSKQLLVVPVKSVKLHGWRTPTLEG
jgi:hypothetical protein